VVLIHGVLAASRETWWAQKPLTERWTLHAVDRPGHGDSPGSGNDFLLDADLILDQVLTEPSHVVGYSYGTLSAILVASKAPELVRSLMLVEPAAPHVAMHSEAVAAWALEAEMALAKDVEDPAARVRWFFDWAGVDMDVPDPLPDWMVRGAHAFEGMRLPTELDAPLDAIRQAGLPAMVISGGHLPAFEDICDAVASAIGARRETVAGLGHLVPSVGEPFNSLVEDFWLSTDAPSAPSSV
jgi:pimeloyl-ACP methyl ester carboxylesterase